MKIIGQLTESELKEYNSGKKDVVKKYLKEDNTYILKKTLNKYREGSKIINKIEDSLEKTKTKILKGLESVAQDEIEELLSNAKNRKEYNKMVSIIEDELTYIFDGTNSSYPDDFRNEIDQYQNW
jgi:vacuolar-type H+-ATPase subunit H